MRGGRVARRVASVGPPGRCSSSVSQPQGKQAVHRIKHTHTRARGGRRLSAPTAHARRQGCSAAGARPSWCHAAQQRLNRSRAAQQIGGVSLALTDTDAPPSGAGRRPRGDTRRRVLRRGGPPQCPAVLRPHDTGSSWVPPAGRSHTHARWTDAARVLRLARSRSARALECSATRPGPGARAGTGLAGCVQAQRHARQALLLVARQAPRPHAEARKRGGRARAGLVHRRGSVSQRSEPRPDF